MTEPVPTFFVSILWYASEDVPEDIVYDLLKLMYEPENKKFLEEGHPMWKEMEPNLEEMKKLGIPIHPGALKFYEEMGVPIP